MTVDWRNPLDSLDVNHDQHISPIDALLVINELNTVGSRQLADARPDAEPYIDTNGDRFISPIDALLVINSLNRGDGSTRALSETPAALTQEKTITMTVGQSAGTRRLSFQIDTNFDTTSSDGLSRDVFNVYVVDQHDESTTLVDRGTPGTPVFSLREDRAEAAVGLATWDGHVLEIDVGNLAAQDTATIKLQLINGDKDLGSTVRVTPVDNRALADTTPASRLGTSEVVAAVGGAVDISGLSATDQLSGKLQNVRFDSKSGLYEAELVLENNGTSLRRDAAVLLPDLPAGVTAFNASGTTTAGVPYWNLHSAIGPGGLAGSERSRPITLQLSVAKQTPFVLLPQFLVGAANRAPVLAQPAPLTLFPGATIATTLSASDPDGDALTYSIVNFSSLPTGSITSDGALSFTPTPEQLGTYTVIAEASDGALIDRKQFVLTVAADPITTTRISGRVLNVDGQPLSGMRVEIGSVQGLTNASGDFLLDLGNSAPVSDTVRIRGDLFNGGGAYPFIAEKIPLLLDHAIYTGYRNVIARPIYLPQLNPGSPIDPAQDNTVTSVIREDLAPAEVDVKAGTLLTQQGAPFTGALSITEVPVNLTPASLPPGLKPDLVVTIQPGEMSFASPAPLALPNRAGYAPGTVMDLWSINPVSGQFEKVGVGQVSDDGTLIQTTSGGIRNSSWHFFVPPPEVVRNQDDNPYEEDDDCDVCKTGAERPTVASEVDLQSGAVYETHDLVSYQSLGQTRGLTLSYSSEWADPQHIVHFGYNNSQSSPNRFLVGSMSLNRGAFSQQVPGFELRQPQATDFHDTGFVAKGNVLGWENGFNPTFSGTAGQVLGFDQLMVVGGSWAEVQVRDDSDAVIYQAVLFEGGLNTVSPLVLPKTGTYKLLLFPSYTQEVYVQLRDVSNFGLRGGEHFWAIPDSGGNIDASLLVDMSNLPTGIYNYTLQTGLLQFTGIDFAGSTSVSDSHLIHVNRIASPFGSGWGMNGLQEIIENPDGSLLVIDGSGSDQRFGKPLVDGGPYVSPAADFTVIEKLQDGTFRRTLPDQTVYAFNARNQLEWVSDRNGNATHYVYDAGGRLTAIADPVGLQTVLTYTGDRVTAITDPAGRVTRLEYDPSGNLTRVIDPDSSARTFGYDARHRMTSEVDQLGNREEEVYDFAGRAAQAVRKDGSIVRLYPVQVKGLYPPERTVNPLNAPDASLLGAPTATFVDGNGNVVTRTLNRGGQAVSAEDGLGGLPVTGYNSDGLPSNSTDARGNTLLYTYDAQGNLTRAFDDLSAGIETISGTVATPGAEVHYALQLTSPTLLYFDGLTQGFQSTLSGPNGIIFSDRSFEYEAFEDIPLLPAGAYTLTVRGEEDKTGQYQFRLRSLNTGAPLPLGGTVNGSLSPASETDIYSFQAAAGDRFNFRALSSNTSLDWRLIDQSGLEVFSDFFNDEAGQVLGIAGTYYLVIEGSGQQQETGSYSFSVQPLGNQPIELPAGTDLVLGEAVSGTLADKDDKDVYRFTLTDASNLYFDVLTDNGDFSWSLTGPSGVLVTERPFLGSDWFQWYQDGHGFPAGEYALTISSAATTAGDYGFRLLDRAAGTPVTPGQPVSSTLAPRNETDIYRFNASAGQSFYFDVQNNVGLGNARWELIDPRNDTVFTDYLSDVDVQTLAVSGTYTLLIEGYYYDAGESGDYTFNIQPVANAAPQPLLLDSVTSGDIAVTGESARYTFALNDTTSLYFDVLGDPANFTWTLTGPAGTLVDTREFGSRSWYYSLDDLQNLPAGAYELTIDAAGDATGQYSFRLLDTANALPLTVGMATAGTLSPHNATSLYRFDANAGDSYFFDVQTSTDMEYANWRLLDPYGQEIFNESWWDVDTLKLPVSGRYTLFIESYDGNASGVGEFTFNVQPVTQPAPLPLSLGSTTSGTIAITGEEDRYTFSLSDTASLYFDALSDNVALTWTLVGPAGTAVSNRYFANSDWDGAASGLLDLPAGNYQLTVDGVGDDVGPYLFRLFDLASASPLVPGSLTSSTLSPRNETDAYRFTANAGSRFFFDAQTSIDMEYAYWYLIDPYGNALFSQPFYDVDVQSLPATGEYTLLVEGYYGNTTGLGEYSFVIQPVVDAAPQPLTLGNAVTGEIALAGQQDRYTFSLNALSSLYFDTLDDNANMQWSLTGPAGKLVTGRSFVSSDWYASLDGLLDLPAGNYELTIDAPGDVTGDYNWRLLDLQAAPSFDPDTPVSGTLSPRSSTNAYRFDANAGDTFSFKAMNGTDMGNAAWRLISPYGKEVFLQSFGDVDNVTLSSSGVYTLLIEGYYAAEAGVADYQFDVQFQGNTPPTHTGTPLTLGSTVDDAIGTADELDRYIFTLGATSSLYFDALSDSDVINWSLTGPAGELVSNRTFNNSNWYSSLDQLMNLPAGEYTLVVGGAVDAATSYRFRLLDLASGAAVTPGVAIADALESHLETDVYRFSAAAGDQFYFDAQTSTDMGSATWRLIDPYGNDVFNQSFSDVDTLELHASGDYTLLVEGYYGDGPGEGTYAFEVQPFVTPTVQPLVLGDVTSGSIGSAGAQTRYSFHLTDTTSLYFDSLSDNGNVAWTLIGPAGMSVDGRPFSASDWYASLDGLRKLPAGDYTLIVDAQGDVTGDYSFRLFDWASAETIALGAVVSGSLSPGNETNAYRFSASAGDRLFFDVRDLSGVDSARWRVMDPFGNPVFAGSLSDVDTLTLGATGNYTLFIEGYSGEAAATGTYSFFLQPIDDAAPVPEQLGSVVAGTLAVAGEQDRYAFTLSAPASLYFDWLSDQNQYWSLTGPSGVIVSNATAIYADRDAELGELHNLPAGAYTLTIDGEGDATGDYRFKLMNLADAPVLTLGEIVSSELESPMTTNVMRFDGTKGQRIFADAVRLGSGLSDTGWRLLDPYGNEVFHDSFVDIPTVTLPVSGTYTLLIEGSQYNTDSSSPVLTGIYGARAGAIGDSQLSAMEVTLDGPAGAVAFDRFVASEGGYDLLRFYVDGELLDEWSGSWETERVTYDVAAGSHTYRWEYSKDSSISVPDEAVWIDNILFPNAAVESFEAGGFTALPWTLSGDANWTVEVAPPANPYSLALYEVTSTAPVDLSISVAAGTTSTYDPVFAQLTSYTDELGRQTLYDIDPANGNRRSITQVVGLPGGGDDLVTQITYTAAGLIDSVTDPLGRKTNYDYDSYGRLVAVRSAVGTADETLRRLEYADLSGNIAAVIDGNGNRTEFQYDAMNHITSIHEADPDGGGPLTAPVTLFTHDARGNVASTTDADGGTTQYQYDSRDRLVKTTASNGSEQRRSYDLSGNLSSQTDELGLVSRYRYDARNRLIETIDPAGGSTRFAYDADNNLVSLTDPAGNVTRFEYDSRNRVVREIDPLGQAISYQYDLANHLIAKTDRDGRVTEYAYDDLDRLASETWVGGNNVIHYSYDRAGNLVSVNDAFSGLSFIRDALERVKTVDNAGTPGAPPVTLSYAYDDVGNVLSVVDTINGSAGAVTNYQYDALNRTARITQSGPGLADKRVDFGYNPLGQASSLDRYSDLAGTQLVAHTANTYDTLNRLVSSTHSNGAGTLAFYNFSYDASGRITRLTDVDGVTNYAYDTRDQLTGADRAPGDARGDETYRYDANGNRISSSLHSTSYVTGGGNRLLTDGQFNYEYDGEGNLVKRTEIASGSYREFTWDYRNRLVAAIDKTSAGVATQEVRFTYDGLDRRISKAVDQTPGDATDAALLYFVYDREDVVLDFADADGSGPGAPVLSERYLHGPGVDEILAQDNAAGSVQWMLADHLGSVHDLIDNAGVVVKHIVYDSYGNVLSQTGPVINTRYLFTGREFDGEIDASYYRARYYDAGIGRFISEDPIRGTGGDANIVRYVGNAPVSYVDPYGLKARYGGKLPTGWRKDTHLPANQKPWDAVGGRPKAWGPQPTHEKISLDDLLSLFSRTADKIKNFFSKCKKAQEIWELTHKKDKGPKDAPVFWKKVWEMFPASDTLLGGFVSDALDHLKQGVDRYDEMLDRRVKDANNASEE